MSVVLKPPPLQRTNLLILPALPWLHRCYWRMCWTNSSHLADTGLQTHRTRNLSPATSPRPHSATWLTRWALLCNAGIACEEPEIHCFSGICIAHATAFSEPRDGY